MLTINRGSHSTKINIPTKKTKILSARPNKPKQMILLFRKSQEKINNLINPHERSQKEKRVKKAWFYTLYLTRIPHPNKYLTLISIFEKRNGKKYETFKSR